MNRTILAIVCSILILSCAQEPVRPIAEDIQGMNVRSIKGQVDYGYSLKELWLMKERGKISMAGSGAANNGVYNYHDGMTLEEFITLAGGHSICTSGRTISVKRILENDFFAIGEVPLDGRIETGDTVYLNCIK